MSFVLPEIENVSRKSVALVLEKMSMALGDPSRWTFGALARDSADASMHPEDPSAKKWSLEGMAIKYAVQTNKRSFTKSTRTRLLAEVVICLVKSNPCFAANDREAVLRAVHEELMALRGSSQPRESTKAA